MSPVDIAAAAEYPLLAREELLAHSKSAKSQDMDRIAHSPNSEDWVTWNCLHLLQACCPGNWWRQIVDAAAQCNPAARLPVMPNETPAVHFWRRVNSPAEYERRSRERMLRSVDPASVARAANARRVEGQSEIDLIFETRRFLVFVEAKLGSDIKRDTTNDPDRNQVVRNIDCLLESAGDREPVFWMAARDTDPAHTFAALIQHYRDEPAGLHEALPHRDPHQLDLVARRLSIIRWRDIGAEWLAEPCPDALAEAVRRELLHRI